MLLINTGLLVFLETKFLIGVLFNWETTTRFLTNDRLDESFAVPRKLF